jgi:hypothetical protein
MKPVEKVCFFHVNIRIALCVLYIIYIVDFLKCGYKQKLILKLSVLSECIGFYLKVLGLTWGVWDSSIFDLQPTIILGADVLYDSNGEK